MEHKGGTRLALLALCSLALLPSLAQADVYVLTKTYILEPLPSLQADFGPPLPSDGGIDGVLVKADPLDACNPFTFTDTSTPWVALISREQRHKSLECTFDVKVRHAEEAGARAAIVFDDLYESLIIMSKPIDHPDPGIPAVFVSEKAGSLLIKLLQLDEVHVRITPVSAVAWISMIMSAFLGLLAMTIVFSSFYVMRTWSYWLANGHQQRPPGQGGGPGGRQAQQNQGLPPEVLRSFPVIVHESKASQSSSRRPSGGGAAGGAAETGDRSAEKGASCNSSDCDVPLPPGVHAGETKRMCTICLEHYEEGEKVRILPCCHRFHMQCIDSWLSGRSACPVCKHDASKPLQAVLDVRASQEQQQEGGASGADVEAGGAASQQASRRSWWPSWLGRGRNAGSSNSSQGGGGGLLSWLSSRRQQEPPHEADPLLDSTPPAQQQQQQQQGAGVQHAPDIEAGTLPAAVRADGAGGQPHGSGGGATAGGATAGGGGGHVLEQLWGELTQQQVQPPVSAASEAAAEAAAAQGGGGNDSGAREGQHAG